MPYDEGLAERIRELLEDDAHVAEQRMFGGIAFLAHGHMAVGIIRDELMVRVGPAAYEAALALPHARPMDFTARPMRGFVQVAPPGFAEDADLRAWIARGISCAADPAQRAARPRAAKRARKAASSRAPTARKT